MKRNLITGIICLMVLGANQYIIGAAASSCSSSPLTRSSKRIRTAVTSPSTNALKIKIPLLKSRSMPSMLSLLINLPRDTREHILSFFENTWECTWREYTQINSLPAGLLIKDINLEFNKNGNHLLLASDAGFDIIDSSTGAKLVQIQVDQDIETPFITSTALSNDGSFAIATWQDHKIEVYDIQNKANDLAFPLGNNRVPMSIGLSPNNDTFAVAIKTETANQDDEQDPLIQDGLLLIGNIKTPTILHTIQAFEPNFNIEYIMFSPDGTQVAVTDGSEYGQRPGRVKIYNVATGTLLHTLIHANKITDLQFSANGTRFLTASHDKTAKIWDLASGTAISLPHTHPVGGAHFNADESLLITRQYDTTMPDPSCQITVWNAITGTSLYTLGTPVTETPDDIKTAFWHPSGTHLIAVSFDGTFKVFDSHTGILIKEFNLGEQIINASISPTGKIVVGGSKRISLWQEKKLAKDAYKILQLCGLIEHRQEKGLQLPRSVHQLFEEDEEEKEHAAHQHQYQKENEKTSGPLAAASSSSSASYSSSPTSYSSCSSSSSSALKSNANDTLLAQDDQKDRTTLSAISQ